jgi:3'(2'), 5'-bisphosphate nucleotidase
MKLTLTDNLEEELEVAAATAVAAGRLLLANYDDLEAETKGDSTIVTIADKESSAMVASELRKAFPNYGLLDEETKEDGSRFSCQYCWVVDPLDNTKDYFAEFENRKTGKVGESEGNFGVIIGLMRDFQPVLGVTYKPLKRELAYAIKGHGAYLVRNRKARPLNVSESEQIRVLASRSRKSGGLVNILERLNPEETHHINGSLKTIEVAKGNYNLFVCPASNAMRLWDFCGPQIILEEAGGRLTDLAGKSLNYRSEDTKNYRGVIASNGIIHEKVIELIHGE